MALDILIVDDERDIRDLVAGVLSDEGYLRWVGQPVARVVANAGNVLAPEILVLAD